MVFRGKSGAAVRQIAIMIFLRLRNCELRVATQRQYVTASWRFFPTISLLTQADDLLVYQVYVGQITMYHVDHLDLNLPF